MPSSGFAHDLSVSAQLLSEPARAAILIALMDDVRLPAGELARIARVTPQTASAHLAKLCEAGLLAVESQGRHRYFKLADPRVADAIESLSILLPTRPNGQHKHDPALRRARVCYHHLAGEWGVRLEQRLLAMAWVEKSDLGYRLTETGTQRLFAEELLLESGCVPEGKACVDWTERRHHIGGHLGRELLTGLCRLGWLRRSRNGRALIITECGAKSWRDLLEFAD